MDIDGELVIILGYGFLSNWIVIVSILNGIGDLMVVFEGNMFVMFMEGWVNFIDFSIMYNVSDYKLLFNVSKFVVFYFNVIL